MRIGGMNTKQKIIMYQDAIIFWKTRQAEKNGIDHKATILKLEKELEQIKNTYEVEDQ